MTAPFGVLFREGRGRRGVRRCAAIRGGGGILWGGAPFRRESVRGRSGFPNRKNVLRRSGAFGRENTLGRSSFIGRVRLLFVSRRVILIFRRAQMTEIRVEAVFRRRPEDRVPAAGQADEKSVNSREGPMFWKMRFGYRVENEIRISGGARIQSGRSRSARRPARRSSPGRADRMRRDPARPRFRQEARVHGSAGCRTGSAL